MRPIVVLCCGLACASAARAQDVEIVGSLSENVYASARSSGVAVVGAQIADDAARDVPSALDFAFYQPRDWVGDPVCVSTEAADGLYDGRGTFRVTDPRTDGAGAVRTSTYPTDHFERLVALRNEELAIAVRRGDCGGGSLADRLSDDGPPELAVAFWRPEGRGIGGDDTLRLLINPFDAQQARLAAGNGTFPCTRVAAAVTASYSMTCEVSLEMLGVSPAELRIETLAPGRPPTASELLLHYPDSPEP